LESDDSTLEVEFCYFDTTVFPKLNCATSITELEDGTSELTPLGDQKFSNYGLIRIGGRYHIFDYSAASFEFREFSPDVAYLRNLRDSNFEFLRSYNFKPVSSAIDLDSRGPPTSTYFILDDSAPVQTVEAIELMSQYSEDSDLEFVSKKPV
jgi:hypothetical protein